MLMLEIYFDETGHGDDPNVNFFGIVGCLEKTDVWENFEAEWNAVLKAEGLEYFHMNEFAHSIKAFKGWNKDEPRRRKLYGNLWNIIHKVEPIVIGCFVDLDGYRGRLGEVCRNIVGDAYYLCYLHCLKIVSMLVKNVPMGNVSINNFATIFDEKKGFKGKAMGIYEHIMNRFPELQETIPPPIFGDMRKVSPIQVADIIAYESHKEFTEQTKGAKRLKERWGFNQLETLLEKMDWHGIDFGDVDSPIAFYSQNELARITVAYDKHFGKNN